MPGGFSSGFSYGFRRSGFRCSAFLPVAGSVASFVADTHVAAPGASSSSASTHVAALGSATAGAVASEAVTPVRNTQAIVSR